jgi:hypothetical protein
MACSPVLVVAVVGDGVVVIVVDVIVVPLTERVRLTRVT